VVGSAESLSLGAGSGMVVEVAVGGVEVIGPWVVDPDDATHAESTRGRTQLSPSRRPTALSLYRT
jgi:hypothetical protein